MTSISGRHRRVRLVVGEPGAAAGGIQEAFVEEVRRIKSGDPLRPLTVLVGSNYIRLHLQRLLAVKLGGHANISFKLLKDLSRDLGAAPLVDKGFRRLPEFGSDLLLAEVVSARSHGTYFDNIAGKLGFIEALSATIRDLKDAAVEPATLRAAAAGIRTSARRRGTDDAFVQKLDDLADLYEMYGDLLMDRRFYDQEDLMRSAVQQAAATHPGPAQGGAAVIVYGFYDATWAQRRLIQESLAFTQGAVFVPCGAVREEDPYEFARPMLDWLASWIPERHDLPASTAPTGHAAGPEVTFLSAPGEARETLEAVRWLIGQARDRSFPFGELALLYRSEEPYARLAAETMSSAGGVPHFQADGAPMALLPAARALLLLMDVRASDFSRRAVIDFFACAEPDAETALWDRLSREAGVVNGIEDWRGRLARHRGSGARAAAALRGKVDELHAALHDAPASGSWRAHADHTIGLIRRFVLADACSGLVEGRVSSLGALDDVSTPVDRDRFVVLTRRALEQRRARTEEEGEFQRSGIFVGNVMEARLLSFHAAAVVGLVEKCFPLPPRQDPILLDTEREAINRLLGPEERLSLKRRRQEEERLLFHLAKACAGESLLLSYPRLDPATARPRNPSPFLLRAASDLAGRLVDYEALDKLPRMRRVSLAALAPKETRAALLPREFDLCALQAAASDPSARRRVTSFLEANPLLKRAMLAERARWGEARFTAHDGVILRPNVRESLTRLHPIQDQPISAGRIESYATCPLRYFMSEVLDLEALVEPEESERADPRDRGILVHRILFEVFTALRRSGLLPLTREHEAEALVLLDQAARRSFGRFEAGGVTGYPLLWEIDKERILEDLGTLISMEAASAGHYVPAHFEIRYGMKGAASDGQPGEPGEDDSEDPASMVEPVLFEIHPGRHVMLKGRIDRIEITPDGSAARVTDYKTGEMKRYSDDSLEEGTSVQLPLYMLAAEKLLRSTYPAIRAAQARYLSVDRRGRFKSVSFSAEALESHRGELARVLATVTNGIAHGVFFAYPDPAVCGHCDYRLACGEGREARFERKRKDATASDFLSMKEVP
jgi:RecB family exonuclease